MKASDLFRPEDILLSDERGLMSDEVLIDVHPIRAAHPVAVRRR